MAPLGVYTMHVTASRCTTKAHIYASYTVLFVYSMVPKGICNACFSISYFKTKLLIYRRVRDEKVTTMVVNTKARMKTYKQIKCRAYHCTLFLCELCTNIFYMVT
jgi:hypothetical protein